MADLVGSPLGTQLQFWRTTWMGQVGASVAIGLMIVGVIENRSTYRVKRAILGALALLAPWMSRGMGFVVMIAIVGLLFFVIERAPIKGPTRPSRYLTGILGTVLGVLVGAQLGGWIYVWGLQLLTAPSSTYLPALLPGVALALGLLAVAAVMASRRDGAAGVVAGLAVVVMAVLALVTWDGRSEWTRYVEGPLQPALEAPGDSVVLVEDGSLGDYLIFERPLYFNTVSGAGVVFSRPLAMEFSERRRAVETIGFIGSQANVFDRVSIDEVTLPTSDALIALCRDSTDPMVILLRREVVGLEADVWRPAALRGETADSGVDSLVAADRFFHYNCQEIIEGDASRSDQ